MDIFWSTVYPMDVYADHNMLYKEPLPLLDDLIKERASENPDDFFACPAFQQHAGNMFIVRSTVGAHLGIRPEGFIPLDEPSKMTCPLFSYLPASRKSYRSMLFDHRMLFFSEKPVTVSTYPAYMHWTEVQSKLVYMPAAYDISRWLQPLQGTYEVPEAEESIQIRQDDPLYYVRFETTKKVKLRRFQLVPELLAVTQGCGNFKVFRPQSSLEKAYAAFSQARLEKRVAKLIKENLLE